MYSIRISKHGTLLHQSVRNELEDHQSNLVALRTCIESDQRFGSVQWWVSYCNVVLQIVDEVETLEKTIPYLTSILGAVNVLLICWKTLKNKLSPKITLTHHCIEKSYTNLFCKPCQLSFQTQNGKKPKISLHYAKCSTYSM